MTSSFSQYVGLSNQTSLLLEACNAVSYLFFSGVAVLLVERMGRRGLMMLSAGVWPNFLLKTKSLVVTGGARGLGLVMSQAIIELGSDLAIIDLGSTLRRFPCLSMKEEELINKSKGRRLRSRPTT